VAGVYSTSSRKSFDLDAIAFGNAHGDDIGVGHFAHHGDGNGCGRAAHQAGDVIGVQMRVDSLTSF